MPSTKSHIERATGYQEQIDALLAGQAVDGTQNIERAWALLIALADEHSIPVTVGIKTVTRTSKNIWSLVGMVALPLMKGTRGLEVWGKSIVLETGSPDALKVAVLAHEIAHILLDHQHRDYLSSHFMELEADATAYLVARHLGVDRQSIMGERLAMCNAKAVDSASAIIATMIIQLDQLAAR